MCSTVLLYSFPHIELLLTHPAVSKAIWSTPDIPHPQIHWDRDEHAHTSHKTGEQVFDPAH